MSTSRSVENGRSLKYAASRLDDSGAAILSVLEADKQGSARVDECHRLAAQDLEAARARAQAILRRTDERIAKLQVLYLQRIEQRVSELEEASPPPSHATDEVMPIAEAVERLAVHLTS
jgi:hypothetical protein